MLDLKYVKNRAKRELRLHEKNKTPWHKVVIRFILDHCLCSFIVFVILLNIFLNLFFLPGEKSSRPRELYVLWNAPLQSWTDSSNTTTTHIRTANEAINYLMPLSHRINNLIHVGDFVEEYVEQYPKEIHQTLKNLHMQSSEIPEKSLSIYVTQYDPRTYAKDSTKYNTGDFDYRIGRAMFETSALPTGWAEDCNFYVDEIWTPTHWGKEIFRNQGVNVPITVIPESTNCDIFKPNNPFVNAKGKVKKLFPKEVKNKFVFLSIFKWEDRKNWQILIQAFHEEFRPDEDVALVISTYHDKLDLKKVIAKFLETESHSIYLLNSHENKKIDPKEYPHLFHEADAFVLPTHGEGWGRPIVDAMASGLPTITTDWSGITEYMSEDIGYLLPISQFEQAYPNEKHITGENWSQHEWATIDQKKITRCNAVHLSYARRSKGKGFKSKKIYLLQI